MRRRLQLFGLLAVACVGVAIAGINWKAVWLEPRMPVVLTVGEKQAYTIMGLNGADTKADLTTSPDLKITSSEPTVLEIDQKNAFLIGKKPGQAEIRISFSEATSIVQAFVRERQNVSTASSPH